MKMKRTPKEAMEVIKALFDRYDLDWSPGRDRSKDGERFQRALTLAALEGYLKPPPAPKRKRGRSGKWTAELGLELVERIERIKSYCKAAGRGDVNSATAIRILENLQPKWLDFERLDKRYGEAAKHWKLGTRLLHRFPLKY